MLFRSNLAKNAKVNDERSDSNNASSNSTGKKSNLPGDDGLLNVPKELQGTWYTYPADDDKLETIKISHLNFPLAKVGLYLENSIV